MTKNRKSIELSASDWERLDQIAFEVGAKASVGPKVGETGWRALVRQIAQGKLVVVIPKRNENCE